MERIQSVVCIKILFEIFEDSKTPTIPITIAGIIVYIKTF